MNPGHESFAVYSPFSVCLPFYWNKKELTDIFSPEITKIKFGQSPKFAQLLYAEPAN